MGASVYLRGITYQCKAFDFYQSFLGLYRIDLGSSDLFLIHCFAMFHSSLLEKIALFLYFAV